MDYEKEYKKALERAKNLHKDAIDMDDSIRAKQCEIIFPELKENEDEKIRNLCEELVRTCFMNELCTKEDKDECITWLERQGNIDKASYEIAEKEKYDFVNGQFIQCRKSFDEFKEYNSYWFEYIGNDTYVGRSDNILNKKFHITPRQLYRLFTQQHDYSKENNEFEKQMDKGSQVKLPIFTFDDVLALQCCMETVKKVQEDKDLYEKLKCLHGRVYDAYYLEKQGKSKFEQCTQDGDKIVTNEDGTHFNVSQLERVSQKSTETKETAKEFLKSAKIMDENGKLADEYRLEKQGEQEEPQVYETEDGEVITYSESEGYKVVEPKFKVGDWIVDNFGSIWKIEGIILNSRF